VSSAPSPHSNKHPAAAESPDPGAVEDVTKNVPEFIHNPKSYKFYKSWKLPPGKYEHYSKFVFSKQFDELSYFETVQVMEETFGQNFSLFNARFNYLKLATEHDENLYDFSGIMNFRCGKFSFGTLTEEQSRCLIFTSVPQTKPRLPQRTSPLKLLEEKPNVKLQEMVKEGIKMTCLTCDSTLIDSNAKRTRPVQKISASVSHSAKFVA
ncbi:unnamed protein product, partial [Hymenolepis diminuta]